MKKAPAFFALVFLILSCAPPSLPTGQQDFVPDSELLAVSLYREANYYYSNSRYLEAEEKYRKALELSPGAENISLSLAMTLKALAKYEQSLELFQGLLRRDPNRSEYHGGLGALYYEMESYELALSSLDRAMQLSIAKGDRVNAALYARNKCNVYFKQRLFPSAVATAKQVFELQASLDNLELYARMLFANSQYQEALELLSKRPDREKKSNPLVLSLLAIANSGVAKYEESFAHAKRALEFISPAVSISEPEMLVFAISSAELGNIENAFESAGEQDGLNPKQLKEVFNARPLESELALYWPRAVKDYLKKVESF